MNIPIPFIGGGSGDSDECTATASDVLEGKTAVYNGSDDEPAAGTMKDYSGTTQSASASMDDTNSRVSLAVPNTGKYDTAARLYTGFSNLASAIGVTADKIANGEEILGVVGTVKEYQDLSGDVTSYTGSARWSTGERSDTIRYITFADMGISSLDFTPVAGYFMSYANISYADVNGVQVVSSSTPDYSDYYPASANSNYSFTKNNITIPFDYLTSHQGWYVIFGYK